MPNAVTRPPRGTMTRFARMPVTEARLKWKARMGGAPRDAAAGGAGGVRGPPPPNEGTEDDANDGDRPPRQWWKLQETGEEEEDPGKEPDLKPGDHQDVVGARQEKDLADFLRESGLVAEDHRLEDSPLLGWEIGPDSLEHRLAKIRNDPEHLISSIPAQQMEFLSFPPPPPPHPPTPPAPPR